MSTSKPSLRCTRDYNMFDVHPHNRDIGSITMLEKSMRQFGFDPGFPLRCIKNGSGKLKITHGHHRFHVAQKLRLPVWFVVAQKEIPLFESEASSHNWNVRDYSVARARAGDENAQMVIDYHRRTGIRLSDAISLVGGQSAGSSNKQKDMRKGTFIARPNEHADNVAMVVEHCRSCGVQFASNTRFVTAVSKCLRIPDFDVEIFMHKVKQHVALMEPRRTTDEYISLIELVYNRLSKNKMPVAFLASEAMRSRGPIRR